MLLAAAAFTLLAGGGLGLARGDLPDWAQASPPDLPVAMLRAQGDRPEGGVAACLGEYCQPRVSLPGQQPAFDARGKRTELVLAAIDRMRLGALSSIARAAGTAGVRVDWRPPQLGAIGGGGPGGLGKLDVGFRWRLDAWHGPTWLSGG